MLYQTFFINRRLSGDADVQSIKVSLLPLGEPFKAVSPEDALSWANFTYPQFRPHLCIGEHRAA